mmetsp:Transcript_15337/g.38398  ORF Transcript_15337/g.38398 Transcript_15337/m.38398 type:complete len:395 (+) Transcript_15337:216-1400(+)
MKHALTHNHQRRCCEGNVDCFSRVAHRGGRLPKCNSGHHAHADEPARLAVDGVARVKLPHEGGKEAAHSAAHQYGTCPEHAPRRGEGRSSQKPPAHDRHLGPEYGRRPAAEHGGEGTGAQAPQGERQPKGRCHQIRLSFANAEDARATLARYVSHQERPERGLCAHGAVQGGCREDGGRPPTPSTAFGRLAALLRRRPRAGHEERPCGYQQRQAGQQQERLQQSLRVRAAQRREERHHRRRRERADAERCVEEVEPAHEVLLWVDPSVQCVGHLHKPAADVQQDEPCRHAENRVAHPEAAHSNRGRYACGSHDQAAGHAAVERPGAAKATQQPPKAAQRKGVPQVGAVRQLGLDPRQRGPGHAHYQAGADEDEDVRRRLLPSMLLSGRHIGIAH